MADSCVSFDNSSIPEGMQLSVLISIFCKIAGMNCDPATLISNAACVDSCIPAGIRMSVLVSLACQILQGGGGGGVTSQEVFPGHYGGSAPGFVPASNHAVAPDLDAPFVLWAWNPDTQLWQ